MHPTIVLAANTHTANQYRGGKEALFSCFVSCAGQGQSGDGGRGAEGAVGVKVVACKVLRAR